MFCELWQMICTAFILGAQVIRFASALMTYLVVIQFTSTKAYIPKSRQSQLNKLADEYCGVLRSWIKQQFREVETFIHTKVLCGGRTRVKMKGATKSGNWQMNLRIQHIALTTGIVQTQRQKRATSVWFDTDSRAIKIDNCATASTRLMIL
jgi:hypothetical protein